MLQAARTKLIPRPGHDSAGQASAWWLPDSQHSNSDFWFSRQTSRPSTILVLSGVVLITTDPFIAKLFNPHQIPKDIEA